MRLLYVDDMTENFFFMENLIIGRDIELFTAINGVQALEIMENNDFDVIVTDIMMPEMDGFTLSQDHHKSALSKVIIVLGATNNQMPSWRKLGVDEYHQTLQSAFLLDASLSSA